MKGTELQKLNLPSLSMALRENTYLSEVSRIHLFYKDYSNKLD